MRARLRRAALRLSGALHMLCGSPLAGHARIVAMIEIKVRDNRERNRFELEVDGGIAFADYELKDGVIVFTHTRVSAGAGGARRRFGAYSGSAGAGSRKGIESCLALLLRYRFF